MSRVKCARTAQHSTSTSRHSSPAAQVSSGSSWVGGGINGTSGISKPASILAVRSLVHLVPRFTGYYGFEMSLRKITMDRTVDDPIILCFTGAQVSQGPLFLL